MDTSKLSWLDIRSAGPVRTALIEEALHARVDAIVAADPADLATLPPTVRKVLLPDASRIADIVDAGVAAADLVVLPVDYPDHEALVVRNPTVQFGVFVEVLDAPSLAVAVDAARTQRWTVLRFADPTKIPLEIVLAAAAHADGTLIVVAEDVDEAAVVLGVLEHGPAGVLMAGRAVGDAGALRRALLPSTGELDLVELEVVTAAHVGLGERACVDTCSFLREDEGILVGSHSKGMVLCVSETHPLPYMPTRPFRVNAGAIHSYTMSEQGRTQYLSELRAGSKVLAVDTKGRTRLVTVGRVKIETRPLLSVSAVAANGQQVNLILQDDWHVRVLGPGGAVLNSTELRPGDMVLGHLPTADRHVGYPIDEFCLEQ
jgi:3-amino-4-hydroxybenzoic acid synthase